MEHIIAYNPYKNGNKGSVSSQPLSVYDKTIAYPWMAELVAAIRGGNDELKKQLPFRCAHYYQFRDNRRSQKNAVPESFLFQTTIDVDDKEYVDKAIEKARELNCSDTIWNGALLHLEYSARKKLHIDIRMPIGMTIEETQRAYCKALGVPCDESCFTPERILFITDQDSEIYRSKDWYAVLPADELKARREAYLKRGLTIDGRGKANQPAQPFNIQHSTFNTQQNIPDGLPTSGTASEKSLIAFDLFTETAGLKNVNIDTEGSRHSSLLAIMSAGASRVMSEEELRRVVAVKMPSFAQERDCQQLIHDFYEKYGDSSKPFSRDVIRINAQAETQANQLRINNEELRIQGASAGNQTVQSSNLNVQSSEDDYPAPPEMPKKLPKLVELLVSQTPDVFKPAVAHAIFPPLATHLCRTYFNYIDNVEHEATLMCCLLAGTGAGKNCVQMPINLIMEDIRKRDKDNLKREKEWKDEVTRKGANKDKRKRPENLVIQEIDADMTNPAFVMRTAEAQEHFLYTALNEIDQFDNLRGIGNQQFRIMCLAFDPGNQYGQTRVGTQSVTERVTIRFNWNASTTINKGIRYFSKVLTDGPISRINFCTIPEREIGAEMPVYGTYDDTFRENLKPYIEHLNMASGTINCPEAFALAQKLKEENADFARMSQDRVYEIEEFVRWSEQYDLYCKMRFFRDAIVKSEQEGVKSSKRGPSNMLQLLPNEFSYQQAEQLRSDLGLDTKGTRRMIATWVFRKYIVKVEAGEKGVNAGNDKADNSHCNYNYGNYSFYRKLCFLKKESK